MTCTCPEWGIDAFCENHGLKTTKGNAGAKARQRLKLRSDKQMVRDAFLAGVKAQRLADKPWCENCGTESHETQLDLHHIVKRSQGPRFDGAEYGVDRPQNLSLLCRRCHELVESRPEWMKSGADDDRR